VSGALAQDQIVTNRITNNTGGLLYILGDTLENRATLSRAENLNGQYSVRSFVSYSLPLKFIKSNINFDLSGDVSRNPGIITPVNHPDTVQSLNTFSYSQNYGGGVTLSSNISQNLDFNISSRAYYNNAYNTLNPDQRTNYFNQISRIRLNWVFYKGFVFQTDFTNRYNTSVAQGASNINICNLSVGKNIFKKQNGDIRLTVYDLLKQNQGFRQIVNADYLEEVQSLVLQRYFMLTFTYNIRKFGNGSSGAPEQPERGFGPGRDGGGRGNWNGGGGGMRGGGMRGGGDF
jgi:hypothetical protein